MGKEFSFAQNSLKLMTQAQALESRTWRDALEILTKLQEKSIMRMIIIVQIEQVSHPSLILVNNILKIVKFP